MSASSTEDASTEQYTNLCVNIIVLIANLNLAFVLSLICSQSKHYF